MVATVKTYKTTQGAARGITSGLQATLYHGDCLQLLKQMKSNSVDVVVTSPPYCMSRAYEKTSSVSDFISAHEKVLPEIVRVTKINGSICWQVGYHVKNKTVYPLDYAVYSLLEKHKEVRLRNRIIWTFGHGLHDTGRFSGRHETVLWFTKGEDFQFNLDAVRVRQKYPGKRHYKGPLKGEFSGNPLGKNPGDVWEIPNVKGNHIEKSDHPCQFPVGLVQRIVRGLCPREGIIFDPFMGSGSSGVAAVMEGRRFVGAELDEGYLQIARSRVSDAAKGNASFRPLERPIFEPDPDSKVARLPAHFVRFAAE